MKFSSNLLVPKSDGDDEVNVSMKVLNLNDIHK